MPEGNELHRWAERYNTAFAGKPVQVDGPQGRFVDGPALSGRRLRRVIAVGKHLGFDFGRDRMLHVHLGLRGDFTDGSGALPEVRGALRLRMWNAAAVRRVKAPEDVPRKGAYWAIDSEGLGAEEVAWMELRGPTDCTVWTEVQWAALLARLGPDPLNGDPVDAALARIAQSARPIGALLMDQEVAAGIGNIYRAELLFRARQSPFTAGRDVEAKVVRRMWNEAGPLMRDGMRDRRIVTTLAKDRPHSRGPVQSEEAHYVYRRNGQPCRICGTAVRKQEDFFGRNLFWCAVCQKG